MFVHLQHLQQGRSGRTERDIHRQQQQQQQQHRSARINTQAREAPTTTRVICSDLGAVRPGFSQQGIRGASQSSTTALRCQKPSFSVTALNLAESNRQERREGENQRENKQSERSGERAADGWDYGREPVVITQEWSLCGWSLVADLFFWTFICYVDNIE